MNPPGRLRATGLVKRFSSGTTAVDSVGLTLSPGQRLALIGRSGSGKSTLLRLLLALEQPDAGSVSYGGRQVVPGPVRRLRWFRRRVQYIPQDPAGSLDPRLTVAQQVSDPLRRLRVPGDHRKLVDQALDRVHLGTGFRNRRRAQLSGGQAQRVAIARALATGASVLLADEPVSGLDLPLRDGVLALLRELSQEQGTAILMVTHDLEAARRLCEQAMVMAAGQVVEAGPLNALLTRPGHEETRRLRDSVPRIPAPDIHH